LPLAVDPFDDWHQALVPPGDTRELIGRPLVPMYLSRLRWVVNASWGLVLVDLSINSKPVAACAGVIVDLSGSGCWRFPPVNVDQASTVRATVRNMSGAPLRVSELTLWGPLAPASL
jgi:hypothetical protein